MKETITIHAAQHFRIAGYALNGGKRQSRHAHKPTGYLDSKKGDAVMKLFEHLHDDGATICIVTHDPRFAECANRRIALFDGQVVDEGTLEELREMSDICVRMGDLHRC